MTCEWRHLAEGPLSGVSVQPAPGPLSRRLRRISARERREEARAFLETFHEEAGLPRAAFQRRWAEVRRALIRDGHYDHTPEELAFGARLAWRNHGRCIGRLFWESLEVIDCRHVTEPETMAEQLAWHMRTALGDGRIKSIISVFAPVRGDEMPAHVESGQLTQYAGYLRPDGTVLGDRQSVEATRIALSLGWRPEAAPSRFDLLPVVIRDRRDRRSAHVLPEGTCRHVPIAHPDHPALGALGLQWHAVPAVSAMILSLGGIDYPCAPFNGFFMCTEIASRDFADAKRYDLLPDVARALGLDPEAPGAPFWRDTALTELNRAVMHSYREAGVTMVDHHTASDQFMQFHAREQSRGRAVAADWRWIVPPQASGICDVFHLKMRDFHPLPNYYVSHEADGSKLLPWYGDRPQGRLARARDRVTRRLKLWNRMGW